MQIAIIECNEEIDVEVSLDTVMKSNLSIVGEISKTINSNRLTTIWEFTRKKIDRVVI